MRTHNIYGKLISYSRIMKAWNKIKSNHGTGSINQVSLDKFGQDLEVNLQQLLNELKSKTYAAQPVKRVYIPKGSDELRPLGLPTVRDKIVQQLVVDALTPIYEGLFHPSSLGYRPGRGAYDAFKLLFMQLNSGLIWVYDADIHSFFDNMNHHILIDLIRRNIADESLMGLIKQWLKAGIVENGIITIPSKGSPQGSVISPLLANIYLNQLDWALDAANLNFVRYADDLLVTCANESEVGKATQVIHTIKHELKLELSRELTVNLARPENTVSYMGMEIRVSNQWYSVSRNNKAMIRIRDKITNLAGTGKIKDLEILIRGNANYCKQVIQAAKNMVSYEELIQQAIQIDKYITELGITGITRMAQTLGA